MNSILSRESIREWMKTRDFRVATILLFHLMICLIGVYVSRPKAFLNFFSAALYGSGWHYREILNASWIWWAFTGVLIRIVVPGIFLFRVMGLRPAEAGFRGPVEKGHGKTYLILYLLILIPVIAVSFLPHFHQYYPMYWPARDTTLSFRTLLLMELMYVIQFVGIEAYFRGYLLFSLKPYFGIQSIFIAAIPYTFIHVGKPPLEVFFTVLIGPVLGYLALRSGTWLYGLLLHCGVALSMDAAALLQRVGIHISF